MNETTGRTARIYRRLISVTGSLELTTIGLLWLFGLVLAGTFYQLGHSIHETTLTFFHSWLIYAGPIPLPAGQLMYVILGVNLVVSAFTRIPFRWSKAGLFIIHIGLILLVVGGLTQRFSRRESVLVLAEGQSDSYSYDLRRWELVVGSDGEERYPLDALPEDIDGDSVVVVASLPDAELYDGGTDGIANTEVARALGPATAVRDNPVPGVILRIAGESVLLYGGDPVPTTTESGIVLRLEPSRYAIPAELRLEEFTAEFFEGTGTPKSFTSRVRVIQGDLERPAVISMNEPLRLQDYTIYQLAYDASGARDVSVFQVVQNPLRWLAYVVSLLISAGLLLHFVIRVVDVRRRRSV